MDEEPFVCIVFCPICATNQDVEGDGLVELECADCGTKFAVNIEPEIVAAHAMVG